MFGNNEEYFISLYNALSNSNLDIKKDKIVRTRLENTVYKGLYNDVSMEINGRLIVLVEQQSTINNNMPLRFLEYLTELYKKYSTGDDKYKKALIPIPTPEFYVIYNGQEDCPAYYELKLSDAFMIKTDFPQLDLAVRVYNINKNDDILKSSESLKAYAVFVQKAEQARRDGAKDFIKAALDQCKDLPFFKPYIDMLQEKKTMMLGEYNYEDDIRVQRQEAFEQGEVRGEAKGARKTAVKMINGGLPLEQVVTFSGLTLDEVKKLKAEMDK